MSKRIVILGGGFGGVYAARALEKRLRPEEASITLINRENYFVYQPMLPEVISGSIGITDIVSPIRLLCPRTNLVMRDVEAIDLEKRMITASPGFHPRRLEIGYDYLVIALGGITNFYGMPGMLEHALPFRTLVDALTLRNRVISCMEEADVEPDPAMRKRLVSFVVGGGGFSGVEVIAELNDFVRATAKRYRNIPAGEIRCVLVHSGERILPEMDADLAEFAQRLLRKRGVEIRLKDRLVAASSEKAILKSGDEIAAKTIVSTVPSKAAPVLEALECAKEGGRLLVDGHLELKGQEGVVWALGDCAAIKTAAGNAAPPTAQHATREADTVAANIEFAMRGGERKVFAFEGLGKLGALGHLSAVADVFGIKISGILAWLLWRTIYLMKMPGLNRKVRIGADWLIALLFPPDLVQLSLKTSSGIKEQHFEPGEAIFLEGDVGDSVYVIRKGEVDVMRRDLRLATLKPGEYFGEMAVLSGEGRNATVRAKTAVNVLLIDKGDFDQLKNNVPAFGEVFAKLAQTRSAAGPGQ
jgi:NADH dehydrogenase